MRILTFLFLLATLAIGAQDDTTYKALLKAEKKAKSFVYKGNELLNKDQAIEAEMEYRRALSEKQNMVAGAYNLAHTYYKNGSFNEALYRSQEAAKSATTTFFTASRRSWAIRPVPPPASSTRPETGSCSKSINH